MYVTNLSNRECEENQLKAVKVTIPSLQPISFVHSARFHDSKRVKTFAKEIYGYFSEDLINPLPLPFS